MNKIYKVVWSKVKNCYVVVSEIAKNVITGGVKSAKVGKAPLANGLALSALMAFVITGQALAADGSILLNSDSENYTGTQIVASDTAGSDPLGEGANRSYGLGVVGGTHTINNGLTVTNKLTGTSRNYGIAIKNNAVLTVDGAVVVDVSGVSNEVRGIRNHKNGAQLTFKDNVIVVATLSDGGYLTGIDTWGGTTTFNGDTNISANGTGCDDFVNAVQIGNDAKIYFKGAETILNAIHNGYTAQAISVARNNAEIYFDSSTVKINATSNSGATGIGGATDYDTKNSKIKFDGKDAVVDINVLVDIDGDGKGDTGNSNAVGIMGVNFEVTDKVKEFNIEVMGSGISVGADGTAGINVTNRTVDINAGQLNITIEGGSQSKGNRDNSHGIKVVGNGDIDITSDTTITVTDPIGNAYGVYGKDGADIDLADTTITTTSNSGYAFGTYSWGTEGNSSNITVDGDLTIDATGKTNSMGVYVREYSDVVLGNENKANDITITVKNTEGVEGTNVSGIAVYGNETLDTAAVTVNADNLNIKVDATGQSGAYGINANSAGHDDGTTGSSLTINANRTVINAKAETEGYASAIVAFSDSKVSVEGDLEANADRAIFTRGGATTEINKSGNSTVVLNGDIVFGRESATSGEKIDANVLVNLTGEKSKLAGSIYANYGESSEITGMQLNLSGGANWNVTGDSFVNVLGGTEGKIQKADGAPDDVIVSVTGNEEANSFEIAKLTVTGVDLDIEKGLIANTNITSDSDVKVPYINANDTNITVKADTLTFADGATGALVSANNGTVSLGTTQPMNITGDKVFEASNNGVISIVDTEIVVVNGAVTATGEGSKVDFSGAENVTVNGDVTLRDKASLVLGDATVNGTVNINDSNLNVAGNSTIDVLAGNIGNISKAGEAENVTVSVVGKNDVNGFEITDLNVTGVDLNIQKGLTTTTQIKSDSNVDVPFISANGNDILVEAGTLNVSNSVDTGAAYAIKADNASKVSGKGNVNITATGNNAYGVDALSGSTVELGGADKTVSITATGKGVDSEANAVFASGSRVNITAGTLTIDATSENVNQPGSSLQAKDGGVVNVVADNATINGMIYVGNTDDYTGTDKAKVDMTGVGDITIGGVDTVPVIQADKGGTVLVGSVVSKTNIVGDVYANNGGGVRAVFGTDDSVFTGSTKVGTGDGAIVFELYDGATWEVTESSNISKLSGNDFNVVAAKGAENVKVTIDGDNHVKADAYEEIYREDEDNSDENNTSKITLKGVDLEIIDETGGGLEASGQGANTIIDSLNNVKGVFGEVGIEAGENGKVIVTAADVNFTTGETGIEATNGGKVDITATNVTFNTGGQYENSVKGGAVHITNEAGAGSVVSIKAAENVELTSKDRYAINNRSRSGGLVEVFGKNVTLISENRTAVKAGGHVGNEGLNGIVTVGNENTETITIKGHAQNPYKNNEPNEHKGAVVYAQGGTVNLSATDDIEITDTRKNGGKTVAVYDGGTVNIKNAIDAKINGEVYAAGKDSKVNFTNVENVNITETKEHGISVNNGGKVDVVAENVTIDSYKAAVWLDDLGDNAVTIKANGNVNLTSEDRFAVNNESIEGSLIDVSGKNVVVASEDRTAVKAGGMLGKEGKNGTVNISGENVTIQGYAQNTVVEDVPNEHNASVVYAQGKGVVNLSATDALAITDTAKVGGNAVSAYEGGTINIKDTDNLVVDGAVYANGEGSKVNIEANKGSISGNVEAEDNASVVVTLKSKEASFTGATKVTNAEKGVTLNLQQGATWNVTGDSTVSSVIGDNFNITKATGVNEEVTVTIDGRHADGITDDYASTTSTITGVDLVLHEDDGLNGNQTIISDSDIMLHSKGNGIAVDNGNYVTIEAAEFTLNQGTGFDAIRAENGGVVNIGAVNAVLDGSVYASGAGSVVDFASAENVTVDGAGSVVKVSDGATVKAGNITLTGNGEEGKVEAISLNKGDFVATGAVYVTANGYSAYGVEAVAGSTVELGASDKDVTLTITSNGTGDAEAQAISAEGGSKVTVNANKLGITTTANSKVAGSLQARDKDSEITVKANNVDIKGDMWAGEGAKVAINTTAFAVEGSVGSVGLVDIITGDVAYDAKTQFYTEDAGVINLAGGNVTGEINVVKGNVNLVAGNVTSKLNIAKDSTVTLTGATFATDNIETAIVGNGKLVVDNKGILETTADQVFTVGGKDTVTADVDILANNNVKADKVTYKAGTVALSDDYSYEYLTSINDVMKGHKYDGSNLSDTKVLMTGELQVGTGDKVETKPGQSLTVDQVSGLDNKIELDNVTVEAEKNLIIGAVVTENSEVKVSAGQDEQGKDVHIEVEDSVEKGFSANQLDLGEGSTGAVITGGETIVLGGSQNDTSEVAHEIVTVEGETKEVTIVVGTETKVGDNEETHGKLEIGNSAAQKTDKFQLTGKAVINKDSELKTKGETKITKGVELKGGKVTVEEGHHLIADITVSTNDNDEESTKSEITGKVTGNLKVKDKPEGHPSTMIHLGNDKVAGKLHAKEAELKGATLFLDPSEAANISEASMFTLENADTLDGNYVVGKNSVIAFGVSDEAAVEEAFAKIGLTFGNKGDVNAVVYVAGTTDVTNGSIIADGSLTSDNASAVSNNQGVVNFAANSLLMVDADQVKNEPAITGVTNATIESGAKLYIDEAKKGENYQIIKPADGSSVVASWSAENISTNNQLIKFTDVNVNDGKLELKAEVKSVNEAYGKDVIIGNVIDAIGNGDNVNASEIINSAANDKVNADTAAQVDALNSIGAMNEVAGVTHTTYAVSNILTDAVADHVSLANGKEHDKDIWAHYVHTKEDVDGLGYGEYGAKYSAQYNGIVVGADLYREGKATMGAALTYVDGNINGSSAAARNENDAKYYGASIYGSIENKDTAVIADVSYLHGEHDITQRNSGNVITGKPESDAFSVGVRVEKAAKAGMGKLVPYAGLRYMHLGTGNYTNSIGLAYDADDAELFLLPVGLKYSADIKNTNGWTVRPVVEFGYVWAFGDTDTDQTVSLNGVSNGFGYDVTDSGSYIGRFMLEAEKANISYALGYEYQKGDDVKADKWMVNVNWKF